MPAPLEELRKQRALLQQHLDWLNQKIADAEQRQAGQPTPHPVPPTATSTLPQIQATETVEALASDASSIEDIVPPHAHTPIDIDRLKLGCIGLVASAILFFLFLLFGLPYLID